MTDIMKTLNGKVTGEIDGLLRELATLRAENRYLRSKRTRSQRYSAIVRRALIDAHSILMAAFSDEPTGAVTMARTTGMGRRRWQWAVAFLRYAGVVAMHNADWRSGLTWVAQDLAEAVDLVEIAAVELDGPDGYKQLKACLHRED